jgi:HAD superfamily hydrolase (TIGR01509 family)
MRALIFDLDGTLIDTVYVHVLAWQQALAEAGIARPAWHIHRRIGMGVNLFVRIMGREVGREMAPPEVAALRRRWRELYARLAPAPRPLPGAAELLRFLRSAGVPHAIATGSQRPEIDASLEVLGVGDETLVVEGKEAFRGKPEPDLFLACQRQLGARAEECCVVGDGVHDLLAARRAGMLGIGLLTGGQREDELTHAGAFRVYQDPAELQGALEELGFLPECWPAASCAVPPTT